MSAAAAARGRVVFVGAGPGMADLITVRGADRLRSAEVVLFDSLADPALRGLAPKARWIDVGKRGRTGVAHGAANERTSAGQAMINALLVKQASEGKRVVRLKGGDPGVFGRLEEELEALAAAGIECEVVPGVSAAMAAAAATQRPLTRRGSGRSVSLATAMTGDAGIQAGHHADTEVFYMAGRQLALLAHRLAEAGWPGGTPACVVSRAGWPDAIATDHTVATLADATALHAGRPAVVTLGAGATPIGTTPPRREHEHEHPAQPREHDWNRPGAPRPALRARSTTTP